MLPSLREGAQALDVFFGVQDTVGKNAIEKCRDLILTFFNVELFFG